MNGLILQVVPPPGDPINNCLVLINEVYGNFWVNADSNVWAIDLNTGVLTEILAPSEK